MEMDEIKPGAIVIELYKKPTDFKRKKLQLLTKKPLYLHLHQTLHKEWPQLWNLCERNHKSW